MKLKKLIYGVATTIAISFFGSCGNYLNVDDYFVDTFNKDSIFTSQYNLERYLWNIPVYFPEEGGLWGYCETPGTIASGESFVLWRNNEWNGMQFAMDEVTASDMKGFDSNYTTMYKIIRKCNTILANIHLCEDLTPSKKIEILSYNYFMRAYAYYILLVDYGPLTIVGDELLNSNEAPEYYNRSRSTFDESVDYVCSEFERAASSMPATVVPSQFGRPTKGAALALVARLRLIQASPSYNGGPSAAKYFGSWKRKADGVNYVSQTYDPKKWAVAAHAAKKVMDLGLYSLHTVAPNTAGTVTGALPQATIDSYALDGGSVDPTVIDPFKSYKDMFSGETNPVKNPEYIWAKTSDGTPSVRHNVRHSVPNANSVDGWNTIAIPQFIIDNYYMEDGRDISNPSDEYPYDEEGFTEGTDKVRSGYTQKSDIFNMYNNREWRFYANIGFHGCYWPLSSNSQYFLGNNQATYDLSGNAGKNATTTTNAYMYIATGYVSKKYIHDQDAWAGNGANVLSKNFPIIRYAEILLSYAEALNNLDEAQTITDGGESFTYSRDFAEISKAFNQIRFRVGLPGVNVDPGKAEFDKIVIRERLIEFFQENRFYYDQRRLGTMEDYAKANITGMNVENGYASDGIDGYFQRTVVNHPHANNRYTGTKTVYLPIPLAEVRKVPLMDQNPGWED